MRRAKTHLAPIVHKPRSEKLTLERCSCDVLIPPGHMWCLKCAKREAERWGFDPDEE